MRRDRRRGGFTLVELVFVMVIIMILAGVVVMNTSSSRDRANRSRATADLNQMSTMLKLYYADNGFYPTTQQGIQALLTKPTTPPTPNNWQGPYMENRSIPPKDPWGNEYVYVCPGEHNPTSFDLYSYGKDGRSGGSGNDADVTLWDM